MNVIFISQCEHKAISRTTTVLDSFAWRRGDRTWMTPITQEGLDTVRSELRRIATRQTAVACYVIRGTSGPKLAWTVGSRKAFSQHGDVPVARTRVSTEIAERLSPEMPLGIRLACLLASASGLAHDFGKFGQMFQDKLIGQGPMKDAVRHEWLSFHLLLSPAALAGQQQWSDAWSSASNTLPRLGPLIESRPDFKYGITSPQAALEFLVFTHHRLPRDHGDKVASMRLCEKNTYLDTHPEARPDFRPAGRPREDTLSLLRTTRTRIDALVDQLDSRRDDPLFWRAVSTLARMGLILADHSVSSQNLTSDPSHGPALASSPGSVFANTAPEASGRKVLNQQLDWHLQNVALNAPRMLTRMLQFEPPGLSPETLSHLSKPATGRFEWQSLCAETLRTAIADQRLPSLVLNIAGTGCGKTRMNVLAIASLRSGETVRVATGLNLRTLTLQTRDAYAEQLRMGTAELACVIGCPIAVRLHQDRVDASAPSQRSTTPSEREDEDGNPSEETFEADGFAEKGPAWLEHFLERSQNLSTVVMSPVVVCTVDFLVKAGDPTEKANHALTSLRLMKSDLVLDEIDSYDPKALVAVMRLVTTAAMFGRHVVASSATLSLPVARALYQAYELGHRMGERLGLLIDSRWHHFLLDDKTAAHHQISSDQAGFETWFASSLRCIINGMGRLSYRPAELIPVTLDGDRNSGRKAIQMAIASAVQTMHERHRWVINHRGQDHHVSLGLIRIANITNAVLVAKRLSALPNVRVACYHSQLSRIHRYLLEKNLDQILTRHPVDGQDPAASLLSNTEIATAVERSQDAGSSETIFLVVASPVEEVGRDHDFDWGVLEPSSTQSIVQPAGRVNRHRLVEVQAPNIGILQFNFREADQNSKNTLVFQYPGLETLKDERSTHPSHDLEETIDWQALHEHGQIDARLRYLTEVHKFACYDDVASAYQLAKHSSRFLNSSSPLWMGATTYDAVPLREKTSPEPASWTKNHQGQRLRSEPSPQDPKQRILCRRDGVIQREDSPHTAWLSWPHDQLLFHAENLDLTCEQAMHVEIRPVPKSQTDSFVIKESAAFGYYKCRVPSRPR